MHRDMGRPSLAEALASRRRWARTSGWSGSTTRWTGSGSGRSWPACTPPPAGEPSYPPLLMVKVLLLQQWYSLSDPQLEEALGDRLSFRRFVGLGLQDATPDHSTISRFRQALEVDGLSAPLFTELAAQLDAQGLVLKQGTLLDATLVASQVRRPPLAAGRGAPSTTDPEAAWTQRGRGTRSHFGYKVHLGVDEDTGLVRRAVLTPANVSESEVADALVSGDERAVYGDRAYESRRRRQWLRAQGINDRIMHRSQASAGPPLLAAATQRPHRAAPGVGGEGLRHPQAQLWLPAGALPRAGAQHRGVVVQAHGLQPAQSGHFGLGRGLTAGPVRLARGPAARDPVPARPTGRRAGLQALPMPLPTRSIPNYSKVSFKGEGIRPALPPKRTLRNPSSFPRTRESRPHPTWNRAGFPPDILSLIELCKRLAQGRGD